MTTTLATILFFVIWSFSFRLFFWPQWVALNRSPSETVLNIIGDSRRKDFQPQSASPSFHSTTNCIQLRDSDSVRAEASFPSSTKPGTARDVARSSSAHKIWGWLRVVLFYLFSLSSWTFSLFFLFSSVHLRGCYKWGRFLYDFSRFFVF